MVDIKYKISDIILKYFKKTVIPKASLTKGYNPLSTYMYRIKFYIFKILHGLTPGTVCLREEN